MTDFIILFCLKGYAEEYARWVRARINREAKRLKVRRLKHKFKPHITLFYRAKTHDLKGVVAKVAKVARKYSLVPFKMGGFDQFQNPDGYWLFLKVHASVELEQLRYELAQSLLGSDRIINNTANDHDRGAKYKFHCSIIRCDPRDPRIKEKFAKLVEYAETKCTLEDFKQHKASLFGKLIRIIKKCIFGAEEGDPNIHLHLLRIRISGRGKREYDLLLKRVLTGRYVWSRYWHRRTIEALKIELSPPQRDVLTLHDASKCHLIADTHFEHKNIIRHTHRPFRNIAEMNGALKARWNSAVGENDRVYFLGDYTGPPPRRLWIYHEKLRYWKGQLTGMKISILGNHDRNGGCMEFEKARILQVDQRRFLLIHDPADKKIETLRGRYDWVIHGHIHNNKMDEYPFINGEKKTINVSAEVINYKPVSLKYLLSLSLDSIRRMRTIDSQPERW